MTFEEMQQVLEGMQNTQREIQQAQLSNEHLCQRLLAGQRDLQEGQLKNQQNIAELTRNVNRLVGFSIESRI